MTGIIIPVGVFLARLRAYLLPVSAVLVSVAAGLAGISSADNAPLIDQDTHYSEMGFFDMHICNWPERPRFFKILFATEKFNEVKSMEVFGPAGKLVAVLDKSRFMPIKRKNKPEKRAFMVDIDIPKNATTGWYSITVKTVGGKEYESRDYLSLARINRAKGVTPQSEAESVVLPVTLKWEKVTGAGFYRVYLRDEWSGELVFESKLSGDEEVQIPSGKLTPGGYYSWVVHARDLNGHILLGDFHMGSMSEKFFFTVAD